MGRVRGVTESGEQEHWENDPRHGKRVERDVRAAVRHSSFTPLLITHSRLSLVSSPFTPRSWREASRATPGGDERGGKGHETRIRMRFTCHASPSSPYRSAPKAGQRPNRTGRGWDRGGIWCSGKPLVSLTLPASLPRYATSRPHSSLSRRSFVVCSVSRVA